MADRPNILFIMTNQQQARMMKSDPHEMVNLIDDPAHAKILQRHREMLERETGVLGNG